MSKQKWVRILVGTGQALILVGNIIARVMLPRLPPLR